MGKDESQDLIAEDFILSLLNAADERAPGFLLNCRDRAVDKAFADAAQHLGKLVISGEVEDLDIQFVIAPRPVWGDSENVFESMAFLASRGYIRQISPGSNYYRFNRSPHENAEAFHNERSRPLPGSIDSYRKLTGRFLAIINHEPVEVLSGLDVD